MSDDGREPFVRNVLLDRLRNGDVVLSMSVRLVTNPEIAIVAKTAGYDSLYVDLEHNSFSIGETSKICLAAMQAGVTPLVRVPSHGPEFISRVLDAGAQGIIAPHVSSAEAARRIVEYAKYPPRGTRSASGLLPHLDYRSYPAAAANAVMDAATAVVVMVETREALDKVEEIAAVDGVDMLFIGTNDLVADLGITGKLDHPLVDEAYARVTQACRRHGKHTGIGGLATRPDKIAEFINAGARYVSVGVDLGFLIQAAAQRAKAIRQTVVPKAAG